MTVLYFFRALDRNEYNHITATYFLLAERKLRMQRSDQHARPKGGKGQVKAKATLEDMATSKTEVDIEKKVGCREVAETLKEESEEALDVSSPPLPPIPNQMASSVPPPT